MRSDTRLACNRLPFQTDSSCDRGDVDIHVFDDFPLCSPINPTPPEAGLPQIDMQVVPITPPPCACVRVDMSGTGRIRNRKDVRVTGNFKAIGDCCDGNYAANISVDIPCIPFSIKGGDEEKSVTIRQTCGLTEPSGTFNPGVTIDNCTVTVKPILKLNIPKPKDVDLNPELILTNDCGTNATGTFSITKTQGDCFVNFRPKLQLNIPPTPKLHVCDAGIVKISGGLGATGDLNMGTGTDSCGNTNQICPTLNLNIPCPVSGIGRDSWGDQGNPPVKIGASIEVANPCDNRFPVKLPLNAQNCNCKNYSGKAYPEIMPTCPARHCASYRPTTGCKGDWDCKCCKNFSAYYDGDKKPLIPWPAPWCSECVAVELSKDSCGLAIPKIKKTIDLGIPCPVSLPRKIQSKAKLKWLDKDNPDTSYGQSGEVDLLWNDSCICDLNTQSDSSFPALKLGLPCPVSIEPVQFKIHVKPSPTAREYVTRPYTLLSKDPLDPCLLKTPKQIPEVELIVPAGGGGGWGGVCPVWVSDVKFDFSPGNGLRIIKVLTDCDGNTWEEEGSTLKVKTLNVVTSSKYSENTFKNKVREVTVLDAGTKDDTTTVFTAVEHACCN